MINSLSTQKIDVKPFDITRGEKVKFGYYAALDVVFKQFLGYLESYFFDEFNLAVELDFEITTEIKFKNYIDSLEQPSPILIFKLPPLQGESLIYLENRSANLILSKDKLEQDRKIPIHNRFSLREHNYSALRHRLQDWVSLFGKSFESIYSVEGKLIKLVSNKIKAKVLKPSESCIIVRINITQKSFSSFIEFCFSAYQLDLVINKYGSKALLAGNGEVQPNLIFKDFFTDILLKESTYEVCGILGELNVSQKDLIDSYNTNKVLPINNEINQNVVVQLNKVPILSAFAGTTNKNMSLQINGKLEKVKNKIREKNKPFSRLRFPSI